MSMYGMMLSGKYWYLDLLDYLLTLKFIPSKSTPCQFIFVGNKEKIYLPNYEDDMLYFGTNDDETKAFKKLLKKTFN